MCWICHDEYHAKCVVLNAGVVDALQDRKAIRWSRKKCKHFRSAFVELSKDFQGLHTKLAKYEESFNNFKVLKKKKIYMRIVIIKKRNFFYFAPQFVCCFLHKNKFDSDVRIQVIHYNTRTCV